MVGTDAHFYGTLRQLAEELRGLRSQLTPYRVALEAVPAQTDDATRDARKQAAHGLKDRLRQNLEINDGEIHGLFDLLTKDLDTSDALRDWWGDTVTRVGNYWADIRDRLKSATDASGLPSSADMKEAETALKAAVLEISYITIPPRLNQFLGGYHNGQTLKFDWAFVDELSDPEDRKLLTDYLYNQPRVVHGIVDPIRNTVTKVAPGRMRRIATFLMLTVAIALFLSIGYWIRNLGVTKDWLQASASLSNSDFAQRMLLVFLGGAAHVAVGAIKQLKSAASEDSKRFISIGNWSVWTAAHEVHLLGAIATLGVVGLVFVGGRNESDSLTLVAVGYSSDSLIDIFLGKFEQAIGKRTEIVASI